MCELFLFRAGSTFNIIINYETTSESSAIDWLDPEQTSGKQHPFLFTQCQVTLCQAFLFFFYLNDSNDNFRVIRKERRILFIKANHIEMYNSL